MPDRRSDRTITDDLLETAVRIKREAGVTHAQIQEVVGRFACQERWHERTGGIGFPLVEDIPQERRGDFMAALAELSAHPDRNAPPSRQTSAAKIWRPRVS